MDRQPLPMFRPPNGMIPPPGSVPPGGPPPALTSPGGPHPNGGLPPTMGMPPMGGPPPMGPPPMAPPPPSDPTVLLQSLRDLMGTPIKKPEPVYRPGYKPPKRPNTEEVMATAKRLQEQNRVWRSMIYKTLNWIRFELTGAFEEDIIDRELGIQEKWQSAELVNERNLIISKGASLKPSFQKKYARDDHRGYAQRLEDFVVYLREEDQFNHANIGNRPLEIDEWSMFTDYGMYASRDTLNKENANCPVTMTLIDPCQVHPVFGRQGLDAVYRVYQDTSEHILAAYGDFAFSALSKIKDEVGDIGTDIEYEVIEYWDTWWRCVTINGTTMLNVVAHEYGDCPWTVQYGGMGESMFTRTPAGNTWHRTSSDGFKLDPSGTSNNRIYQAVPYLFSRIPGHELYESIMARVVTGLKKDIEPPTIRYRSIEAAATGPAPALNLGPGQTNDAMLADEKIEPVPTMNSGALPMAQAALERDRLTGSPPMAAYGVVDKSNVTGVAQSGANDAGQHLWFPSTKAWEIALERKYDRINRMVSNFGDSVKYAKETPRPLIVPVAKRSPERESGYEFSREVTDKVGTRIKVTFTKVDPRDWPVLASAGDQAVKSGFILPGEVRGLMTGDNDYDSFFEEWQEWNSRLAAQQNPDFQKMQVLASFLKGIQDNEGSPEIQAGYRQAADLWKQTMTPPQPPPGQPPTAGPGGPSGGVTPGDPSAQSPFPPGPASQGINPGAPGGVSYPQVGAGPGSQGQPVGRPY